MIKLLTVAAGWALAFVLGLAPATAQADAHAHIGHVMTGWTDTPNGIGLLPTAQGEAKVRRPARRVCRA